MYFLIEHEGSKQSNLKAKEILEFLETELGATVETIISNETPEIKILDADFNLVVSIDKFAKIDEDMLTLIFRLNDYYG